MLAGTEGLHAERVMHFGRSRDHERIASREERREIHGGCVSFPSNGFRTFGIGIEDTSKYGPLGCRNLQRMIATEVADACHADAKPGRCHRKPQSLVMRGWG